MAFFSYARNHEDAMLFRALMHVCEGVYIDVGAGHPENGSVTKAFYDRGWKGINIALSASDFLLLKRTRIYDVNLDLVSDLSDALPIVKAPPFGTLSGDTECIGSSVTNVVHFMRLGLAVDAALIKSIDLQTLRPWIIIAVSPHPDSDATYESKCQRLICDAGFHFVCFDGTNRFYVANDRREFDAAFNVPLNVRDNYVPVEEHVLRSKVRRLELDVKASEHRLLELESAFHCAQEAHTNAVAVIDRLLLIKKTIENHPVQYMASKLSRWFVQKALGAARKLLRESVRAGYSLTSRFPIVFSPLKNKARKISWLRDRVITLLEHSRVEHRQIQGTLNQSELTYLMQRVHETRSQRQK